MHDQQSSNGHIVAFLSLEDFVEEVIPLDNLVRIESINRSLPSPGGPSPLLQWLVIVTAQLTAGQIAMCSLPTGSTWEIFAKDKPYHYDNAHQAATLVRQYLEAQDFAVGKGILNPDVVMDNIIRASTDLWHFEDTKLVPNNEATSQ